MSEEIKRYNCNAFEDKDVKGRWIVKSYKYKTGEWVKYSDHLNAIELYLQSERLKNEQLAVANEAFCEIEKNLKMEIQYLSLKNEMLRSCIIPSAPMRTLIGVFEKLDESGFTSEKSDEIRDFLLNKWANILLVEKETLKEDKK